MGYEGVDCIAYDDAHVRIRSYWSAQLCNDAMGAVCQKVKLAPYLLKMTGFIFSCIYDTVSTIVE